jgi:hypothetical protein
MVRRQAIDRGVSRAINGATTNRSQVSLHPNPLAQVENILTATDNFVIQMVPKP